MSNNALGRLVDRWVSDPTFRMALAQDVPGTLRRAGLELNDAEIGLLSTVDWTCSDAALEQRLSSATC